MGQTISRRIRRSARRVAEEPLAASIGPLLGRERKSIQDPALFSAGSLVKSTGVRGFRAQENVRKKTRYYLLILNKRASFYLVVNDAKLYKSCVLIYMCPSDR